MKNLIEMWEEDKDNIESKSINQLVKFTGDGNLNSYNTRKQIRDYFSVIDSNKLASYAKECIDTKFTESGYILQDIINEIGKKLDFEVQYGEYNSGTDGLWKTHDGHSFIIESRTSLDFPIILDNLNKYRHSFINNGDILKEKSSILIIIGRGSTIDLERQIRGSEYSRDIRIVSVEALVNLLTLKESINDTKTVRQIYEILRLKEITKVDKVIEIIFLTMQDISLDINFDNDNNLIDKDSEDILINENKEPLEKVYLKSIDKINNKLSIRLSKNVNTLYSTEDLSYGVQMRFRRYLKEDARGNTDRYFFKCYQYHYNNLNEFKSKYFAFICDNEESLFLIPADIIFKYKDRVSISGQGRSTNWFVRIFVRNECPPKYYLHLSRPEAEDIDVTQYKI